MTRYFLLFLSLFFLKNAPLSAQTPEAMTLYNKGVFHFSSKDYKKAASFFEQSLAIDTSLVIVRRSLAESYFELGDFDKAALHYDYLMMVQPNDEKLHFNAALIFNKMGNKVKARIALFRALQIDPEYKRAQQLLASLDAQESNFQKKATLEVEVNDQPATAYNDALSLYRTGNAKASLAMLKSIPDEDKTADALYLSALCLRKMGDSSAMEKAYEKTLEKDPNYADAHFNLGVMAFNRSDYPKATKHFENAVRVKPTDPYPSYFLGQAYLAQGRAAEAVPYLREAALYIPDAGEAHALLEEAVKKSMGEMKKSDNKPEKEDKGLSPTAKKFLQEGVLAYKRGDMSEAARLFDKAVAESPNAATARYYYGVALREKGEVNKAHKQFEKAISLDPSFAKAYTALGRHYFEEADFYKAGDNYQQAIDHGDERDDTYFDLGISYFQIGNYQKAEINFEKAINMKPKETNYRYNLGVTTFMMGKYEKCMATMQTVEKLDPEKLDATYFISLCYIEMKRFQEGLKVALDLVAENKEYASGYLAAAKAYQGLNKYKDADKYQKIAYQLDPSLKNKR